MSAPTIQDAVSRALARLVPREGCDSPSDIERLSLLSTLVLHSDEAVRQINDSARYLVRLGELVEKEAAKLRPKKRLLRAYANATNRAGVSERARAVGA